MTRLSVLCDRILEAGWLAALVSVPLYFDIYSSRVFEPDKLTILRCIVIIMCAAYVVKFAETSRGDASQRSLSLQSLSVQNAKTWLHLWDASNPLMLPTFAFALIYLVSTVLSIAGPTSLWGSYQRMQGTYTVFTYIVLFFIIAHNMRSQEQIDRFIKVALLTSIPISLYGIAQHQLLDPLPWGGDVTQRVASTMGNAIFVAAYLIMVVPLTLSRLVAALGQLRAGSVPKSGSQNILLLISAVIIICQNLMLAVFVKGSMASPNVWWGALPMVAVFLLTSLLVFAPKPSVLSLWVQSVAYLMLLLLQLTTIYLSQSRGPWIGLGVGLVAFVVLLALRLGSRRLMIITTVVAVALVAFLAMVNLPEGPLKSFKSIPYAGRMGQLLETESGTGKVRVLIWQGAVKLLTTHPSVGLKEDPINILRPLIGYGPEAMYVAYNKVYPPDLAHYEARNASPDRSHMDLLDHLVMTGILGTLAFYTVLGVAIAMAWRALRRASALKDQLLFVTIIATIIAHFFETMVGIAIASTLTYLWSFFGVAVAQSYLLSNRQQVAAEAQQPAIADAPTTREMAQGAQRSAPYVTRAKSHRKNRSANAAARAASNEPSLHFPMPTAGVILVVSYVVITIVGLMILAGSRTNMDQRMQYVAYVVSFFWLAGGVVVAALSFTGLPKLTGSRMRNWWIYSAIGVGTLVSILLTLNVVVADIYYKQGSTLDSQRQWEPAIHAYQEALALQPDQDFYYLFMGRAFLEMSKLAPTPRSNQPLVVSIDTVLNITQPQLHALSKEDLLQLSRVSLERALSLNPLNTDHHANLARLYRFWSDLDPSKIDLASEYYEQATTLSPQAAHLWAEWAELYLAKGSPAEALEKAKTGAALDAVFAPNFVYMGDAYLALNQPREAFAAHEEALEIDPMSMSDARLESRLSTYLQLGFADQLDQIYGKAAASQQGRDSAAVRSAYGYILSREGKLLDAEREFRAWAQLAPKDWLAHRNLALTYQQTGQNTEALAEANEAKKLAPPDQQTQLQAMISDLESRKK